MIGFFCVLFSLLDPQQAHAWGRQGHSAIAETSIRILGEKFKKDLLHQHSYDVGYYANIPDFLWKATDSGRERERFNHYMRWDVYKRKIPTTRDLQAALRMSRVEFNSKYSDISNDVGRAFWRIREMEQQLSEVAAQLKKLSAPRGEVPLKGEQHKAQLRWLTLAGFIAHYIGDLSQPMHVTENEAGPPGQPPLHYFYEDLVVDELAPELKLDIYKKTLAQWPRFHELNKNRTTLEILTALAEESLSELDVLLKIDKKTGRSDIKIAANAYRQQILNRMVQSSLVLSEILSRHLDWPDQPKWFFSFDHEPEWIAYPK